MQETTTKKEAIKEMVFEKFKKSGGNCGVYPRELVQKLKLTAGEISPIIQELKAEKFLKVKNGQHGELYFFNAKNNLNNLKMNQNNSSVEKAKDLFQKLTLETQKEIQAKSPEIYNAIFGKDPLSKTELLDGFIDQYEQEANRVNAMDDFQEMDLEKQLYFKENFPDVYKEIINSNK